jgi:hypothetical protein
MTTELPVAEYPAAQPPADADALRLASVTVRAVDQIGMKAADEIVAAAQSIRAGAEEIATNLEQLADAVRGHCKTAGEHVGEFIAKTTDVLETIRGVQGRLAAKTNGGGNHDDRAAP